MNRRTGIKIRFPVPAQVVLFFFTDQYFGNGILGQHFRDIFHPMYFGIKPNVKIVLPVG